MNNRILFVFIIIVLSGGILVFLNRQINLPKEEDKVFCTQVAKICPDGSSVGRVGKSCEFVACPKVSTKCSGKITPQLTEGPYYKTGSSIRTNLRENGVVGEPLTITGYVLNTNCQRVSNAWLDFWQADGKGDYDNIGFRLRGQQYTDRNGKYVLETVVPARYSGRIPHIHVKVRANANNPIFTTQLFFPNESQNQKDSIFDSSLLMGVKDAHGGKAATFNFVLNIR